MCPKRTKDNNIQDQNDEAEDTAAGAVLPAVSGRGGSNVTDGRAQGEGGQAELEEEVEDGVQHLELFGENGSTGSVRFLLDVHCSVYED